MIEIPLTQGKVALIDDEDFELVSKYKWCYDGQGYATARVNGKQDRMHRLILGAKKGEHVDHINHNGLDNRRKNLRICNNSQNHANAPLRSDSTTGRKGVTFIKRDHIYHAKIHVQGKHINLGSFHDPDEAARAYDVAALAYFGDFACLNFPQEAQ